MKLNKILLIAAVAFTAPGCAALNNLKSGNVSGAANAVGGEAAAIAEKTAKLTPAAKKHAEELCAPILKEETGWTEERAVGGVVAVSKLKDAKAFLDGYTERDPEKLAKAVNDKTPVLLPDSPKNDLTAQVAIVGKNLARLSGRPDIPWTFAVVTSDTPNALSAPGGYVMVTTGLLKKITNEAQLAGVLGHEIGHVVLKHSLIKYRDGKHKQCIAANFVAYLAENGIPPSQAQKDFVDYAKKFGQGMDLDNSEPGFISFLMDAVIQILQGKNDNEAEFAADKMGLELTAFAGYDASEYEKFLVSLGSSGGFLSSHPATDERVTRLKGLREGELAPFATGTAKGDFSKWITPATASK